MSNLIKSFAFSFVSTFFLAAGVTLILLTVFIPLPVALMIAGLVSGYWTGQLASRVIVETEDQDIPF